MTVEELILKLKEAPSKATVLTFSCGDGGPYSEEAIDLEMDN